MAERLGEPSPVSRPRGTGRYNYEEQSQVVVMPWQEFAPFFYENHQQGEHISIVGRTGKGKTTLGLMLCKIVGSRPAKNPVDEKSKVRRPSRVTVLCYKPRDDTMRLILPQEEWPVIKKWPPPYGQEHCIVWVKGDFKRQRAVFAPLLQQIYQEGAQTIYVPEAAHFERQPPGGLGMGSQMTEFWSAARSNKLTMISDTQRPRWVTNSMWTEPTWIFVFRIRDRLDKKRLAELTSEDRAIWEIMPKLGDFEFMCFHEETIYISKVDLVTRYKRNGRKNEASV